MKFYEEQAYKKRLTFVCILAIISFESSKAGQRICGFSAKPVFYGNISEEVQLMYAVVVSGGKQFKVSVGDIIEVEKLEGKIGSKVDLEVLMTVDGDKVDAGDNLKAKAQAEILSHNKERKVVVFKYKAKKNERKKQGHRQPFTRIKISKIG